MPLRAEQFVMAARVPDTVPLGTFGLWTIGREEFPEGSPLRARVGFPHLTFLRRPSWGSLHQKYGEVVMEDSTEELCKHLPIWMAAHGRVLVSGLGLGCVVRGLLAKPEVRLVDVVEIDPTIVRLIGPEFAGNPRVALRTGDALKVRWPKDARWDCAWHDIWTEDGNGIALHKLHLRLMTRYKPMVRPRMQGAWALPRVVKRALRGGVLGAVTLSFFADHVAILLRILVGGVNG